MAKRTERSRSNSAITKKKGWSKTAKVAAVLAALSAAAAMYKGSSKDNYLQKGADELYKLVEANPDKYTSKAYKWLADHSYNWTVANPLKYGRQAASAVNEWWKGPPLDPGTYTVRPMKPSSGTYYNPSVKSDIVDPRYNIGKIGNFLTPKAAAKAADAAKAAVKAAAKAAAKTAADAAKAAAKTAADAADAAKNVGKNVGGRRTRRR
jgi:hypothetical protein